MEPDLAALLPARSGPEWIGRRLRARPVGRRGSDAAARRTGRGRPCARRRRPIHRRVPRRHAPAVVPMTSILVIEDNEDLAFGLRTALENEGYSVAIAGDGSAGLEQAVRGEADLIILDLMLPKLDGYRVLRSLRGSGVDAPVVLTARGEEANKVQAFSIGGDDYVTKPFGILELMARVRALLRRTRGRDDAPMPAVERFGEIEVKSASRTVYRAGHLASLAPREVDLLRALLKRQGAAVPRTGLLQEVWQFQTGVVSRTVDIHIAELRRKLEPDQAEPRHIRTVWKVGYRLER